MTTPTRINPWSVALIAYALCAVVCFGGIVRDVKRALATTSMTPSQISGNACAVASFTCLLWPLWVSKLAWQALDPAAVEAAQ